MQIDIPLTGPQREFALHPENFPAIVGGLGSGKSEAAISRLVLLMLENYSKKRQPCDTLMTQPTYDLLKLRSMPGTEAFLSRIGLPFRSNKSDFYIDINPFGRMLFRSYDRPERIVSFEVAHSICDELDTLPKEKAEFVWRKISERTRQKAYRENSIGAVTTPDQGMSGFVFEKWEKKKQPGYHLIKAPTRSNPFLPDGYIEQIMANYDPELARCYLEGEFVNFTGSKVYHFFSREKHHNNRVIHQGDQLHIGLDFNIGGCCANTWVIDNNMPIAVDEFVSHDTYDFVNNISRYKGHKITVYPDASGASSRTNASQTDIDIINESMAFVDCGNKNPAVRDRVNAMNALFSHGKIGVNTEKCPELTYSLEQQGWNEKTGEPEKFNDHPAIDDWTDSAGYFIYRRFPISRPGKAVPMRF